MEFSAIASRKANVEPSVAFTAATFLALQRQLWLVPPSKRSPITGEPKQQPKVSALT